jgi:hypothetical protein
MKYDFLIIFLYFGYTLETKYRKLVTFTLFFLTSGDFKTSKITFTFHFLISNFAFWWIVTNFYEKRLLEALHRYTLQKLKFHPFFSGETLLKSQKTKQNLNEVILEGFNSPEVGGGGGEHQIYIFCFKCIAINIKGWLNISTSFLVYSQIWVNIPRDDCHFCNIFLWMIATLGANDHYIFKNH